jgi:hypothetical protein
MLTQKKKAKLLCGRKIKACCDNFSYLIMKKLCGVYWVIYNIYVISKLQGNVTQQDFL